MLLERKDVKGVVKSLYKSSNILASTYNPSTKVMEVIFKGGGRYAYSNIANTDFMRFETAESQGKVMNSTIKPNHEVTKLDPVDVTKVIEAITEASNIINAQYMSDYVERLNKGLQLYEGKYDIKFVLTVQKLTKQTLDLLGYEAPVDKETA